MPDAQRGQTSPNVRVWSTKRFIAGHHKENQWLQLKNSWTPQGFSGSFHRQNLGWGPQGVTFFWLVGIEVTKLYASSFVLSLKLPSSTWVGGPEFLQKNSKVSLGVNHVYLGETQENWVSCWDGWSPHLKHHLQLKTKEDAGDGGLGSQKEGRQFTWRWKANVWWTTVLWFREDYGAQCGPHLSLIMTRPYSSQRSLVITPFQKQPFYLNSFRQLSRDGVEVSSCIFSVLIIFSLKYPRAKEAFGAAKFCFPTNVFTSLFSLLTRTHISWGRDLAYLFSVESPLAITACLVPCLYSTNDAHEQGPWSLALAS